MPRASTRSKTSTPEFGGGGVASEPETGKEGTPTPTGKGTDEIVPPPEPKAWHVSTLADAGFNLPWGIATTTDGTAYVADTNNHQIKKITPEGVVSTIAGSTRGKGNKFSFPYGIAIAPDGTLYVVDAGNGRIRSITLNADGKYAVDTIASGHGRSIRGIAIAKDALYIADIFDKTISKIALPSSKLNIIVSKNRLINPFGIDAHDDALYVTEMINKGAIKRIALASPHAMSTIATGFKSPYGIAIAPDGTLYVVDAGNGRIRSITLNADGKYDVDTIAGSGTAGTTNGIAIAAQFNQPRGIAVVSNTILYVTDTGNNVIRKLEYKE